MTGRETWRLLLPPAIRTLPADLAVVIAFVFLTVGAVFVPGVNDTPLRVVVGLPFVLFIPGYAFIAALFPERGDPVDDKTPEFAVGDDVPDDVTESRGGIDGLERVALSFGTSIAIVPLIGLVLNFTPWGIRTLPIVLSVGGFTVVAAAVASSRRRSLPAEERFRVPYEAWIAAGRTELFEPDSRGDAVLNVVLVLSVLLAAGSVGYAVAEPKEGEAFTELYLLTESEDGELVADGYPEEFVRGESKELYVGIGNHEHEPVNYSLVVELQRVQVQNNSTQVLEEQELRRFETRVQDNETWQRQHNITPQLTGERMRVAYLLYKGQPPAEPTVNNSYREVHLWVNVTARGAQT
ncbi:Uncharacterized membrane protein [Halogranum gelatinilyticum]|uniref:Uncharacterized membrane protein n=1 Tax=Halogranum gelatinilyticum TaxID=660521 RepID=A0A1G9X6U5_9EURY|nr:DUF1616 domain-containing protein [Halogranum gelatinilyticum]SDM92458.1 Uncharacterized membrane protein [Halogranum gelatinilyticum]